MSLPNWKKSRLVRVSRLLADLHRAPPNHASSFLLHTGFPTSLFDLFLKNRHRFNKQPPPTTTTPSDQQHLPPVIPSSSMTDHRQATGGGCGNNITNNKKKILFLGLFKVFLILGLALGAAQFAWVMAAAAFALLSLELLGKSRAEGPSAGKCNIEPRRTNNSRGEVEDEIIKKPVVGSADSVRDKKITRTTDTTVVIADHPQPKSRPNLFKKLMKKRIRHGKKQMMMSSVLMQAADAQKSRENDEKENEKSSGGRSELDANRNAGKSCYLNHWIVMVIVLSGLIAGRIPALLVTVSWCLVLRYIRGFFFPTKSFGVKMI